MVLMGLSLIFFAWTVSCTGKYVELYHPVTGQPIAKYTNTTDSDMGGLEIEFDPETGQWRLKLKSSSQSASDSNQAAFDLANNALSKLPSVK